ncbi:MAG: ParB/RepB/Spo0J family partition protein [Desulfobacterales bacterium]|nr:ParB/RepB/Spo0J family partition protein [Desulfobacterales bacterium]
MFDQAIMKYEDIVISISEIDLTDDTCLIGLRADPGTLVASIQAVGLVSPPVLRQKNDFKYQIVCGFQRIKACQLLGWHKINVRVLLGELSEFDLLKMAIWDNRSHRPLNVIEQAQGIEKLSAHMPAGDRLEVLASILGFPSNKKVFGKLSKLCRLPETIQAGVLDETIAFEAAVDLCEFSPEDALTFFDLFNGLKLSQNKQREIIMLVQEIAIREDLGPGDILKSNDIRRIMDRPELNQNEKGSKVRAYLKQRRFPELTKAEERFSKELKALKLNEHINMTAPPYFEGGSYTLRMTFKNIKDFDKCRKTLDDMAKNPALRRLLEPFDDK